MTAFRIRKKKIKVNLTQEKREKERGKRCVNSITLIHFHCTPLYIINIYIKSSNNES